LKPQNRGAVSTACCNQIERKTIPIYCRRFNEFSPLALGLIFDAERVGERKLARLRKYFRLVGSQAAHG
jgi:hypothetical protein